MIVTVLVSLYWNQSHVVVGGWWDGSYKGAHVTIKTTSLESVLHINLSFWILFHCENRGRKRKNKNWTLKSRISRISEFTIESCGSFFERDLAGLRKSEVSIGGIVSADYICVTLGKRAKSYSCNFARSYRVAGAIRRR